LVRFRGLRSQKISVQNEAPRDGPDRRILRLHGLPRASRAAVMDVAPVDSALAAGSLRGIRPPPARRKAGTRVSGKADDGRSNPSRDRVGRWCTKNEEERSPLIHVCGFVTVRTIPALANSGIIATDIWLGLVPPRSHSRPCAHSTSATIRLAYWFQSVADAIPGSKGNLWT
jgi:hypothetical protein